KLVRAPGYRRVLASATGRPLLG
ncbi:MAG: hypothetical protein QOE87_2011, partial [Gaiellales bacterium]|nr:hypothetical protein [Gaiellales bacterium]